MRILQLSKKMPYPPRDGEAIAILQLTEGLQQAGHSVMLLTMNTSKHHYPLHELPETLRRITDAVDVNTAVRPLSALANLFSHESYHIARFVSENYRQKIIALLQQQTFDIIQLEGIYLAAYLPTIRQYCKTPIVLRAHNIEFEIWERLAQQTQHLLKKWYLTLLARRLQQFELEQLPQVDAIVPISDKDALFFRQHTNCPMMTIMAGLNTEQYVPSPNVSRNFPSVYFLGALDWLPNQEGLLWLLREVLPQLCKQLPNVRLHVAGRSCPADLVRLLEQNQQVVFHGEISDALPFIHSKSVMAIPLFSGSGMRVKIVEAMAAERCVVATTIAAEGIAYTNEKNMFVADTAAQFTDYLLRSLQDEQLCLQIGRAARQLIVEEHDNEQLVARLSRFYEDLLVS